MGVYSRGSQHILHPKADELGHMLKNNVRYVSSHHLLAIQLHSKPHPRIESNTDVQLLCHSVGCLVVNNVYILE